MFMWRIPISNMSHFHICARSVAYLGRGDVRNRYTVKNGISNLYILLKMQEMPFQRPKF